MFLDFFRNIPFESHFRQSHAVFIEKSATCYIRFGSQTVQMSALVNNFFFFFRFLNFCVQTIEHCVVPVCGIQIIYLVRFNFLASFLLYRHRRHQPKWQYESECHLTFFTIRFFACRFFDSGLWDGTKRNFLNWVTKDKHSFNIKLNNVFCVHWMKSLLIESFIGGSGSTPIETSIRMQWIFFHCHLLISLQKTTHCLLPMGTKTPLASSQVPTENFICFISHFDYVKNNLPL